MIEGTEKKGKRRITCNPTVNFEKRTKEDKTKEAAANEERK